MAVVFISHCSEDWEFVEREIVHLLEAHGIQTWYSTDDIKTADAWYDKIAERLKASDWFLVVLSPRSVGSEWVKDETHWAISNRKDKIIPVLIEDCDLSLLHLRLSRLQYVDFTGDLESAKARLLSLWGKTLNRSSESQALKSVASERSPAFERAEEDLWESGYSGRTMLGRWIVFFLVAVLLLVCDKLAGTRASVWILGLVALSGVVLAARQLYLRLALRYELTNRTLKIRSGIGTVITDRVDLPCVEDIAYSQTFFDRLWNVGTITLGVTDGSSPTAVLRGVADGRSVADRIVQAVQRARFDAAR